MRPRFSLLRKNAVAVAFTSAGREEGREGGREGGSLPAWSRRGWSGTPHAPRRACCPRACCRWGPVGRSCRCRRGRYSMHAGSSSLPCRPPKEGRRKRGEEEMRRGGERGAREGYYYNKAIERNPPTTFQSPLIMSMQALSISPPTPLPPSCLLALPPYLHQVLPFVRQGHHVRAFRRVHKSDSYRGFCI